MEYKETINNFLSDILSEAETKQFTPKKGNWKFNLGLFLMILSGYLFIFLNLRESIKSEYFMLNFTVFACLSGIFFILGLVLKSHRLSNYSSATSLYLVGVCIFLIGLVVKDQIVETRSRFDEILNFCLEIANNLDKEGLLKFKMELSALNGQTNAVISKSRTFALTAFTSIIYCNIAFLIIERIEIFSIAFFGVCSTVKMYFLLSNVASTPFFYSFNIIFLALFFLLVTFKYYLNGLITTLNRENNKLSKIKEFYYEWLLNLNMHYFLVKEGKMVFSNNSSKETEEITDKIRVYSSSGKVKKGANWTEFTRNISECSVEFKENISINTSSIDLRETEKTKKPGEFAKIAVLTDGSRYFECIARKYPANYTEIFLFDITHSVMKQREEVDQKYRNTVFAKIAHEFKTPMTNIALLADKIKEKIKETNVSKELRIMKGLSDYVVFLVNDITSYCSSVSKVKILPEPTKLAEIMEFSHNVVCSLVEAKSSFKRKVKVILENNSNLTLMLDQIRLKQVLLNVLSNAAKFITFGTIKLSSQENGDEVLITVKDDGVGIPADKLEQLRSSDEIKFEVRDEYNKMGSGLGVSISKQLCREMGFKLNIESEEGKGTKVTVSIPKRELEVETERNTSTETVLFEEPFVFGDSAANEDGPVVVVAEDNKLIRKALKKVIEQVSYSSGKNWTVIESEDGVFALNEIVSLNLAGRKVEFVVSDEFMDFMNGSALISTLKRFMADRKIAPFPCLSCSAFEDDNFKETIAGSGADWLLTKPATRDSLSKALKDLNIL